LEGFFFFLGSLKTRFPLKVYHDSRLLSGRYLTSNRPRQTRTRQLLTDHSPDSQSPNLIFPFFSKLRILSQKMTEGLWEAGDWGPLERFVAEEYIADTLAAFEPGFRRGAVIPAAEQLGTLPLPGDHPERCQFLVAETLFGEMLSLPRSPHEPVFYHVVVQDLCSQIPTFPKMMAKVVGQMFTQIARMDYEARDRLANWMAHHLSCFDLAWPWRSWEHVKDQESDHPQVRIVFPKYRHCLPIQD